ncbi:MAG TPA: MarR family winged helix-turn-helix transcriptional regulator [Trebonia sp.]|nr:MarR family winged helix-turn-helix transcriptional regulator [Trebonia sp.]
MNEFERRPAGPRTANSFLLAQIGAHAAAGFARRIAQLDLTPAQTGLLRLVAQQPGSSQQELAGRLRTPPSRLVVLVDHLEERGLIERRRNPDDRRHHALYLTAEGGQFLAAKLGPIGAAHEDDICAALTEAEREQLAGLLGRIAEQQGLTPGVHPGYQQLGQP